MKGDLRILFRGKGFRFPSFVVLGIEWISEHILLFNAATAYDACRLHTLLRIMGYFVIVVLFKYQIA